MKFILTADDYGVSPIIDEAIEEAAEKGLITSVAAFANTRNADGDFDVSKVKSFQERFPDISVGLHFTLTCGDRVCDDAVSLSPRVRTRRGKVRRRRFKGPAQQMNREVLRHVNDQENHILDELQAQLKLFVDAGIKIEHFSDHHGVISHTKVGRSALFKVVKGYNKATRQRISMRNPVFISALIKERANTLHLSNASSASTHPLLFLNIGRRLVNLFNFKSDLNRYQFQLEGQMNFLKEMNGQHIPTTNYFVDSFWGLNRHRDEGTVRQICNPENYNVDADLDLPLDANEPTVEIMLHLAKSRKNFTGDYDREMKQLKKCKGIDPHYVEKGRRHELWLLEHCLADCLKAEHRTTFKPYINQQVEQPHLVA